MKRKSYESAALPISFTHDEYVGDKLDYVIYIPKIESRWEIKEFLRFLKNPDATVQMNNGQSMHFYPTDKIRIPVDKQAIIKNKVVAPKYYDSIVPYIDINIKGRALYKNRVMMLDIVANNDWKRPIYFSPGSFDDDDYLWMKNYLQLEGLVYKLVPVRTTIPKDGSPLDLGSVDSDKMLQIVKKWEWGNSDSDKIYHDPETRRESINYRTNLARLMKKLIEEGKTKKAEEVIDLAMTKMPVDKFYYYALLEPFTDGYYKVGDKTKAVALLQKLIGKYQENLNYYKTLDPSEQSGLIMDIITDIERYRGLIQVMRDNNDLDNYNKSKVVFNTYIDMFKRFGRDKE